MYGAILGDIIGSPYEFDRSGKTKNFPLFSPNSCFTDDTVMTIAVAEALLDAPEDDDRIRRHLADRAGMGFETVECYRNILDCLSTADPGGVFLVDSVTSLIQNALFPVEKNYKMDLAGAERCADELVAFAGTVRHAVFVSDYIYSDAQRYSESTEMYRKCLAAIDRRLAEVCDTVIEVSAGQPIIYKGELHL